MRSRGLPYDSRGPSSLLSCLYCTFSASLRVWERQALVFGGWKDGAQPPSVILPSRRHEEGGGRGVELGVVWWWERLAGCRDVKTYLDATSTWWENFPLGYIASVCRWLNNSIFKDWRTRTTTSLCFSAFLGYTMVVFFGNLLKQHLCRISLFCLCREEETLTLTHKAHALIRYPDPSTPGEAAGPGSAIWWQKPLEEPAW